MALRLFTAASLPALRLWALLPLLAETAAAGLRARDLAGVALDSEFISYRHRAPKVASGAREESAEEHTSTKKQVRVYIESGCPDSREFCIYTIAHALKDAQGFKPLINVSLYAWGNAYHTGINACEPRAGGEYNRNDSRCWQSHCKNGTSGPGCFDESATSVHQHGEKEGEVDRLINCAMKHARSPWPFVQCLLTDYEKEDSAAALATACKEKEDDDDERKTIATAEACARSDEGKTLLMQAAQSTPKHPGVPYVTIDGESVDSDNFFDELCSRLQHDVANRPEGCASHSAASAWQKGPVDRTSAAVSQAPVMKTGGIRKHRHHHHHKSGGDEVHHKHYAMSML